MKLLASIYLASLLSWVTVAGEAVLPEIPSTDAGAVFGRDPPPPSGCARLFKDALYNCGYKEDVSHISKLDIAPFPLKRGDKVNIKGTVYVPEDIVEGSTLMIAVKSGIIKVVSKKVNLCQELRQIGLNCPFKKGDNDINIEVDIPKEVPLGKYVADAVAYNSNGGTIGHLQVRIEF